jgi:SAM-dependent methyltransferase
MTMDDRAIDALYPAAIRDAGEQLWTKVAVARRVAEQFVEHRAFRVLDVGAGCGKFCIAAAAAHPELQIVGCERDPRLVELAAQCATGMAVSNVRFVTGDATRMPWTDFDGIYMFRPFDDDVEAIHRIERLLDDARLGMVVVTYNRFGGRVPAGWELVCEERIDWTWLRTWIKRRPQTMADGYSLEHPTGVVRVEI